MSGHQRRKHQRRALARALSVLFALFVVSSASIASAAPAPMCNEYAQSIAAPFPLLPSHNGEASSAPCEDWRGSFELGGMPAPERNQPVGTPILLERAPPGKIWAAPRDRGRALPPAEAVRLDLRPGHFVRVERPPRVA